MTPRKSRLTVAGVTTALTEAQGNIAAAARGLGIARQTLYTYIEKHPALKTVLEDSRETLIDNAESKLAESVENGEAWAIGFVLKTLGRKRGYSEKVEVEHSDRTANLDLTALDLNQLNAFERFLISGVPAEQAYALARENSARAITPAGSGTGGGGLSD